MPNEGGVRVSATTRRYRQPPGEEAALPSLMTDEDCLKCGAWISWGGAMPDGEEGRGHADAACSHRRGGRLRGRSVLFTSVFMAVV